jgi:hypothetical protein
MGSKFDAFSFFIYIILIPGVIIGTLLWVAIR